MTLLLVPATDQRGVARPRGAACDIGAYEHIPTPSLPACFQPTTTIETLEIKTQGQELREAKAPVLVVTWVDGEFGRQAE